MNTESEVFQQAVTLVNDRGEIRRKRPATKIIAISGGRNARNPDFLRMTKDLGLTVLMETGPTPLLGDVPRSRS